MTEKHLHSNGPLHHDAQNFPVAAHMDTDLPCHDAAILTNGGVTAHIALDGQVYTLRITRTRKLILTK
ncbi:hemin uptake protein HemP [Roseinatronobacter alkalisoli]|uniref:Hemin uptake protein HemP n=1 Tax=Roseinatronobacter alkalisoli TaxID=3028235 RepID=A0ABT5T368_9RHOB|nr:hemin uptake protein HemP [Roseinatronobacter sp. HJB301]MDD7969563.1 hemin uptake protein HemP [Roseinatronobacter sp. HJB301]